MCWLAQKSVLYLEHLLFWATKHLAVMRLVLASRRNLAIDDELGVLVGKEFGEALGNELGLELGAKCSNIRNF